MDLLERLGSFAGLAAFFGLALLVLLYFSQARDVRRLREWAGRAPERAGDQAAATQHYLPPTGIDEVATKPRRPLGERIRRIHIPYARYVAMAFGGLVILAGAGFAVVQLTGDDGRAGSSSSGSAVKERGREGDRGRDAQAANISPSAVTVAVLNGTTIAGLAAQVGEEATADGFTLGTVTNAARTDQTRSQVLYRNGQKNAAALVGDRLGIRSIAPVDALTAELAGSFDTVVLVGSDRAN